MSEKSFLMVEYVKSCLKSCEKAYKEAQLMSELFDSQSENKEEPDETQDNEWEKLYIDNLPTDILTGDYQCVQHSGRKQLYHRTVENRVEMLRDLIIGDSILYRKNVSQPLQEKSVDKWKELQVDNLPKDILVDYKYEFKVIDIRDITNFNSLYIAGHDSPAIDILSCLKAGRIIVEYRRKQPKQLHQDKQS